MEKIIDDCLLSGSFSLLDDTQIKVLNTCNRHVSHSGPHGSPSIKDFCAKRIDIEDKIETK